jgi:predicted porin
MKNKFMAAAAVAAILTAASAARADEVSDIKAQSAALKKQNQALEQRLNKLEKQQAEQQQIQQKQAARLANAPAATSFMAADLASLKDAVPTCVLPALDGPLTFCGITVFGKIDAGLGYASHGLPTSSKFYLGDNLVNKNASKSYFGVSPNGLSTSVIGIKGTTELLPGLSGVFWASTNINPQSGQLADAPGSLAANNGLNRYSYNNGNDGSRGGQAFNDQLFVGLASPTYGQLTFGRHVAFSGDLAGAYDPAASNAFSLIGYSGSYGAGLGYTENVRWDDSFKYRVEYGPVHFGAMYKFADGTGGSSVGTAGTACTGASTPVTGCAANGYGSTTYLSSKNDAAQFNLGGKYENLEVDGVLGYFHQATSSSTLSSSQLSGISTFTSNTFVKNTALSTTSYGNNNANTLAATVADTTGGQIAAKYTWNQFKFFAGWSHMIFHNPSNMVGIGGQSDQGSYTYSSVNNGAFPHARLLDVEWVGFRYAYDPKTEFAFAYYHGGQNGYGWAANTTGVSNTASTSLATCNLPAYTATGGTFNGTKYAAQSSPRSSTCSGTIDAGSVFVDYHFTKRFDVYGGVMYSVVGGGMQSGYASASNWAPTVGARFAF